MRCSRRDSSSGRVIRNGSAARCAAICGSWARAICRLSQGRASGRQQTSGHCALSDNSPRRRAGIKPARASEDLPLPEAPISIRKRSSLGVPKPWPKRYSSSWILATRPKKSPACSGWKVFRPR